MTAPRSPKFRKLQRLSGLSKVECVGTLELLWLFTMEHAPAGDVGKWPDEEIAFECGWVGDPGELIWALCESEWVDKCLDHELVIHDWGDHLPEFLRLRVHRGHLKLAKANPPKPEDSFPRGASVRTESYSVRREYHPRTTDVEREGKGREAKGREAKDTPADAGSLSLNGSVEKDTPKKPRKRAPKVPCPETLSDEDRAKLIRWAKTKGWNESHCKWAWNATKDWAHRRDERMACWLSAVRGYMRDGWALKGYRETDDEVYRREMGASPLAVVRGGHSDAS